MTEEAKKPKKASKKAFWYYQMDKGFFGGVKFRKMRRQKDGDRMALVYIHFILSSLPTAGILPWDDRNESIESDLSFSLEEDEEIVTKTFHYMLEHEMLLKVGNDYLIPGIRQTAKGITASAIRQQNFRDRHKDEQEVQAAEPPESFTPPSLDEVKAYFDERQNGMNPNEFVSYYAARGWKVNNGQMMQDWKATVESWEIRRGIKPTEPKQEPQPTEFDESSFCFMPEEYGLNMNGDVIDDELYMMSGDAGRMQERLRAGLLVKVDGNVINAKQ